MLHGVSLLFRSYPVQDASRNAKSRLLKLAPILAAGGGRERKGFEGEMVVGEA